MRYAKHSDSKRGNAAKLQTISRRQERAAKAAMTGKAAR